MTSDMRIDQDLAAARLAASWLLWYPDDALLARLDVIASAVRELPHRYSEPLRAFLDHLDGTPISQVADHLSVVLEFAAVGDRLTGDALLAEHSVPIHLLRDALAKLDSAYVHVLDAIVATLPSITPAIEARMAQLAASGPPAEMVGLEPFGVSINIESIGARR